MDGEPYWAILTIDRSADMTCTSVRVPPHFESLFQQAELTVEGFFRDMKRDPSKGEIRINNDRYVLVRGAAFVAALLDRMEEQFGEDVTREFVYDLAKTIGHSDAAQFAEKLGLKDPVARLSAGPVHFSHTGWAFVDILPESAPAPDASYFLAYDHPNTFESEHYRKAGRQLTRPTCFFSAGYSAGWCAHAFGLDLDAREVQCVAKGDPRCRFVMTPPAALERAATEAAARWR
jgi:predicted hydrocarbon binding protein